MNLNYLVTKFGQKYLRKLMVSLDPDFNSNCENYEIPPDLLEKPEDQLTSCDKTAIRVFKFLLSKHPETVFVGTNSYIPSKMLYHIVNVAKKYSAYSTFKDKIMAKVDVDNVDFSKASKFSGPRLVLSESDFDWLPSLNNFFERNPDSCVICGNTPSYNISVSDKDNDLNHLLSQRDKTNRYERHNVNLCLDCILSQMAFNHVVSLRLRSGQFNGDMFRFGMGRFRILLLSESAENDFLLFSDFVGYLKHFYVSLPEVESIPYLVVSSKGSQAAEKDSILLYVPINLVYTLVDLLKSPTRSDLLVLNRFWKIFLSDPLRLLSQKKQSYIDLGYFEQFGVLLSLGYITDEFLLANINRMISYGGDDSDFKKYYYLILTLLFRRSKNMVGFDESKAIKAGFFLGRALANNSEGRLDQLRKYVKSMSSIMVLSENAFLGRYDDLIMRIDSSKYFPNVEFVREIASNRRGRLLFVTGLLSGVLGAEDSASKEGAKLSGNNV